MPAWLLFFFWVNSTIKNTTDIPFSPSYKCINSQKRSGWPFVCLINSYISTVYSSHLPFLEIMGVFSLQIKMCDKHTNITRKYRVGVSQINPHPPKSPGTSPWSADCVDKDSTPPHPTPKHVSRDVLLLFNFASLTVLNNNRTKNFCFDFFIAVNTDWDSCSASQLYSLKYNFTLKLTDF